MYYRTLHYMTARMLINEKQSSKLKLQYCNDPKFSDRQVWANNVDPDQTGGAV